MTKPRNRLLIPLGLPLALLGVTAGAAALFAPRLPRQVRVGELPELGENAALVASNQVVTPAGQVVRLSRDRPKDVALSPDGAFLAVLRTRSGPRH